MTAVLQTTGLTAFYGDAQALFGIDFELSAGEVVAIIGANGAGKSTFMKSVTGLVKAAPEQIRFAGEAIGCCRRPRRGAIALCPKADACSPACRSKRTR
jgi:branched-chain amino acid transport system ATP-binding protein